MTVREWFRVLRQSQPPSLELAEFLRTFGRRDSESLALERQVLFRVALEELGVRAPDHPNALTFHRMELGSCLIGGSLRWGAPRDTQVTLYRQEPRVVLMLDDLPWTWPPIAANATYLHKLYTLDVLERVHRPQGFYDEPTFEQVRIEAEVARQYREGDWTPNAEGRFLSGVDLGDVDDAYTATFTHTQLRVMGDTEDERAHHARQHARIEGVSGDPTPDDE
jgi:hypothetical protein